MSLKDILEHQRQFNKLIWESERADTPSIMGRYRVLGLGLIEETLELLRTFEFKVHRRTKGRLPNLAHSHEELVDLFKYWLSLADLTDFPIDQLEEMYYAKSRVVQQRYQEEWIDQIGPNEQVVVVDIDNVLADYIVGICGWIGSHAQKVLPLEKCQTVFRRCRKVQSTGEFINAESLGLDREEWRSLKHQFRVDGGKRYLPVFPDAPDFLNWCRRMGWKIILVTSRPIDRYPNIFTDTLTWLVKNGLTFDYLWWATEKSERIEDSNIVNQVVFAVDDDKKFVDQFRSKGVQTFHLVRSVSKYKDIDGEIATLDAIPALFNIRSLKQHGI